MTWPPRNGMSGGPTSHGLILPSMAPDLRHQPDSLLSSAIYVPWMHATACMCHRYLILLKQAVLLPSLYSIQYDSHIQYRSPFPYSIPISRSRSLSLIHRQLGPAFGKSAHLLLNLGELAMLFQ